MKCIKAVVVSGALALLLLPGCSGDETNQQQETAQADSLNQRREQEQQRRDSLAQVRANREQQETNGPEPISFTERGSFSVMAGSWRSRMKAQEQVDQWNTRGFEQAEVVPHGDESTGDVWFRVRIGSVASMEEAEQAVRRINNEYQVSTWITSAQ